MELCLCQCQGQTFRVKMGSLTEVGSVCSCLTGPGPGFSSGSEGSAHWRVLGRITVLYVGTQRKERLAGDGGRCFQVIKYKSLDYRRTGECREVKRGFWNFLSKVETRVECLPVNNTNKSEKIQNQNSSQDGPSTNMVGCPFKCRDPALS